MFNIPRVLDLWNQRNNSFIDTPNILQMMINSRNQISHFCLWHNFLILPFLFIYIINRITNNKEDSPFCIQFFMRIIKKKKLTITTYVVILLLFKNFLRTVELYTFYIVSSIFISTVLMMEHFFLIISYLRFPLTWLSFHFLSNHATLPPFFFF